MAGESGALHRLCVTCDASVVRGGVGVAGGVAGGEKGFGRGDRHLAMVLAKEEWWGNGEISTGFVSPVMLPW